MARRFTPCTRFIERLVRLEDGSPVVLAKHQRIILDHVLTPRASGRFRYQTVVWSEPKKSGKTSIAGWVGSWVLNTQGPRAEVLVVANDYEQSCARVFSEMTRVQQAHPALARRIRKATDGLLVLTDGSTAKPVALDFTGESGANPSIVLCDEAWGIMSERARRLYDELTPPPTRPLGLRWVSSYAGYWGGTAATDYYHTNPAAVHWDGHVATYGVPNNSTYYLKFMTRDGTSNP
jgi:phage terminase large subunit-like protein